MKRILIAAALSLGLTGAAHAVPVTYELGPYNTPGFQATYVHKADQCKNGDLYMCGSKKWEAGGNISGNWDGTMLSVTGGSINAAGMSFAILGGKLGGAFDWELQVQDLGKFIFEDLSGFFPADPRPNVIDAKKLVLWGQNLRAYNSQKCDGDECGKWSLGLDLYGVPIPQVNVPEPGTLALLGLGLAGMGAVRRRRKV